MHPRGGPMTPLQKCLQSLEVLAKADDPNCIPIIEMNIDEFLRSAGSGHQNALLGNGLCGSYAEIHRLASRRYRNQNGIIGMSSETLPCPKCGASMVIT